MLKKIVSVFFVLFCCNFICFAVEVKESVQTNFVLPDGTPTPALASLLELEGLYDPADGLEEMVKKTQSSWIAVQQGKDGIERLDLVDSPERVKIREEVIAIAKEMGLFEESKPNLNEYDYAICNGCFLSGVRMRLFQLFDAWNKGVRFHSLVFLTGERYLRKGAGEQDDFATLIDEKKSRLPFKSTWHAPELDQVSYETEFDMVKLVWEQVQPPLKMDDTLDGNVVFVNALKGNAARPSTADTFRCWLQEFKPLPGTILAASHPLLWRYQQLTGMRVLGPKFKLDMIAPPVTEELLQRYQHSIVTLIFDTVAKCLFEINLIDKID